MPQPLDIRLRPVYLETMDVIARLLGQTEEQVGDEEDEDGEGDGLYQRQTQERGGHVAGLLPASKLEEIHERYGKYIRISTEPGYKDIPCWEWVGGVDKDGYGKAWGYSKTKRAHVLFYEEIVGPIPEEFELDHLCGNRACVNPDHLEPVLHVTNNHRSSSPSAVNARKTTCPQGHTYDKVDSRGYRLCSICLANRRANHPVKSRETRTGQTGQAVLVLDPESTS